MRIPTFSVLKKCKIKTALYQLTRTITISSDEVKSKFDFNKLTGDPDYVDIHPSWKVYEEPELRAEVLRNMRILPDFVSEAEEASLLAEVEPQLKRMRYEFDHWDNAIEGYRETERSTWRADNEAVLTRIRAVFPQGATLLPHAHVLDLAAAGHIKPHVDAVRFCGDVIAGLCLLSSAVMRLTHEKHPNLVLDALLERRCLYIMSGVARYEFTHEVLGGEDSVWRGEKQPRRRRIAIICREQPKKIEDNEM
ncbi:alpha-ketoglutarate-dependent dioxygenase alkB homolog 7, mitochondrial [Epargyreus clarus]|uniref:alpha-ketoglutarate-dependent dioxygenase alkB homolog 7, mitochondrial n=1 Tax=Epargyreus clarus TaxID=520877 RepID=UPI003C2B9A67